MAKGESKVCDDDDEFSYDDLVDMVSNLDDLLGKMKGKYKDLKKEHISLQKSYDELRDSHVNLLKSYEELKDAHNSHISQEVNKAKCDASVSCDLIDCSSSVENVSTSSSISISCDDSPSSNVIDSTLAIENAKLHNTIDSLVNVLAKCHKGENTFNEMWKCQRFTLKHEGLGYIPKKNKSAFVSRKTTFVKESGLFCAKCKNTGHLEKDCIGVKSMSFVVMNASYVLKRSSDGNVYAKFVGKNRKNAHAFNNVVSTNDTKKRSIWVPKALVTNLQGPKQVWVPKTN